MGQKLFGVDIAKKIKQSMGKGLPSYSLVKIVDGDRDPDDPGGAVTQTKTSYGCKGFTENFATREINGTTVLAEDLRVTILGDSLPSTVIPVPEDQLIIDSITYTIIDVPGRDPAKATYQCHARKGVVPVP